MRSSLSAAALLAALATPLAAQDHADHAAAGGGAVPAGWTVRADRGDAKNAKVVSMGQGLHVTTGPAIILYRAEMDGKGPVPHAGAIHPDEAVGACRGIRTLRRRAGARRRRAEVHLLPDPAGRELRDQAAGRRQDQRRHQGMGPARRDPEAGRQGHARSTSSKSTTSGIPSKLVFQVNGQEVYSTEAKGMALDGIVGIRANHNLDLHVEGPRRPPLSAEVSAKAGRGAASARLPHAAWRGWA